MALSSLSVSVPSSATSSSSSSSVSLPCLSCCSDDTPPEWISQDSTPQPASGEAIDQDWPDIPGGGESDLQDVLWTNFPIAVPSIIWDWKIGDPPFKAEKEVYKPTAKYKYFGSLAGVVLRNRNSIVSRRQYPDGVCLNFQWSWVKGMPGSYNDILAVAFRTDGSQKAARSWEINSGIVVSFRDGKIRVDRFSGGDPAEALGTKDYTFSQDTAYRIKITETNSKISITVNGELQLEVQDLPARGTSNHIAVYNREPVAGVEQESHFMNPPSPEKMIMKP
jgi:hypothetical protein